MSINAALSLFVEEYQIARNQIFTKHSVGNFIRNEFPALLNSHISDKRYKIKGSVGQSTWARVPWIAIFDTLVTETAQDGYYIVYLVKEDFSGVYISLNQGVTTVRERYRLDAKRALRARAEDFAAKIGNIPKGFNSSRIDLAVEDNSSLAAYYENGAICSKLYQRASIPPDEILLSDLDSLLSVYFRLADKDAPSSSTVEREDDETDFEDLTKIRFHKRIERNQTLARKVKKLKGTTCEACGFQYKSQYRAIGNNYIEAHHLVPFSKLEGRKIPMDPKKDFAVLCANCHRMIHRTDRLDDIDYFKSNYLI